MEDQAGSSKEEATKSRATRPVPRGRGTFVASYTGAKQTVLSLVKSLKSGKMVFLTERNIVIKWSPTSYKIFEGTYTANKKIVGKEIKLRFVSRQDPAPFMKSFSKMLARQCGDLRTVSINACNNEGGDVSSADVRLSKCWFYITVGDGRYLPLKRFPSGKKPIETFTDDSAPKHPFVLATMSLKLSDDGVVVNKNSDTPGYVQLTISGEKQYQSYMLNAEDAPSDSTECAMKAIEKRLFISFSLQDTPGCSVNVIGIRKKYVTRKIARALASRYTEDTDYSSAEEAADPKPDMDTSSDEEKETGFAKNGIIDDSDESSREDASAQNIFKKILAHVSSDSDSSDSD